MSPRSYFLCILLSTPVLSLAQADRQAQEFMEMIKRPLHYEVRTDRVTVREDQPVGKRADGSLLTVDLYLPRSPAAAPLPVALLLHGGLPDIVPVKPSDWRMYRDWGAALAQSGIAAVMLDHRMGYPRRRLDEALAEVAQVMQWLRRAPEPGADAAYRLDPARVAAISYSAGALLVPELARRYEEDSIAGYVMFYPLLGVDADESNEAALAQRMQFTDALPLLARRQTPIVIFRAGADGIPTLLQRLGTAVGAALAADVALELANLPGAPHAFDSLRDAADTRAAIHRTIEFVLALPGQGGEKSSPPTGRS